MGFVHDHLFDGRPFRILTVVDQLIRRSLLIAVDSATSGQRSADALQKCTADTPTPVLVTGDHSLKFTSKALEDWAWWRDVKLNFIRPGKSMKNVHIESFNGRLRSECLSFMQFMLLDDARAKTEAWRLNCSQRRPHSSLGQLTPSEFGRNLQKDRARKSAELLIRTGYERVQRQRLVKSGIKCLLEEEVYDCDDDFYAV